MTNIYSEADDIMLLYYFIPTADQNNYHHEFMTMNLLQPISENTVVEPAITLIKLATREVSAGSIHHHHCLTLTRDEVARRFRST